MKPPKTQRIIFTSGREPAYPRNQFLIATLEKVFSVEKIVDSSHSTPVRFIHLLLRYPRLLWKKFDLLVVGFVGHPLVLVLRCFSKKPILFDIFISLYDTLIFDRRKATPTSLVGRLVFLLDQTSCKLSDLVLVDTEAHAAYFHQTFGVPREKLRVLYVGCDENLFYPREEPPDTKRVLYYSTFLPLHGTEVVVQAALKIQAIDPSVHFNIIGDGMDARRIKELAQQLNVRNIQFDPPVPIQRLPDLISQSTVCLGGHFGGSEKAKRVIAGKTFQCLAMGKATIVGDNPANRELLTHGKDAWFCEMNNPDALAEAVLTLIKDQNLRQQIGEAARTTFLRHASYEILSKQLESMVIPLLKKHPQLD